MYLPACKRFKNTEKMLVSSCTEMIGQLQGDGANLCAQRVDRIDSFLRSWINSWKDEHLATLARCSSTLSCYCANLDYRMESKDAFRIRKPVKLDSFKTI
jgi:hypothetical protein